MRTVLNRAARVWRGNGRPWLSVAPLIEMLDERQQEATAYPITWSEQAELMKHLPAHLQRMVLFDLNCGARDDNVCKLRSDREREVPELERSVFVIPAAEFKSQRPHVLILNDMAAEIVEGCRGDHDEYVFAWRRERVKKSKTRPVMSYRPDPDDEQHRFETPGGPPGWKGPACTTCATPSAKGCGKQA